MQQRGRKIVPSIPARSIFAAMMAMMTRTQGEHVAAVGSKMRKLRKDTHGWNRHTKRKRLRRIERLSRRVNRQVAAR